MTDRYQVHQTWTGCWDIIDNRTGEWTATTYDNQSAAAARAFELNNPDTITPRTATPYPR